MFVHFALNMLKMVMFDHDSKTFIFMITSAVTLVVADVALPCPMLNILCSLTTLPVLRPGLRADSTRQNYGAVSS